MFGQYFHKLGTQQYSRLKEQILFLNLVPILKPWGWLLKIRENFKNKLIDINLYQTLNLT